jgi:hypothetical protein
LFNRESVDPNNFITILFFPGKRTSGGANNPRIAIMATSEQVLDHLATVKMTVFKLISCPRLSL